MNKYKIIDFEVKGNVVRFALGDKTDTEYWGDDWDDAPYEHNAGGVYSKYIKGYATIYFPFNYEVLTPEFDWHYNGNSPFSKADFKSGAIPCVVVEKNADCFSCYSTAGLKKNNLMYYFEDVMEPGEYIWREDWGLVLLA